MIAKIYPNRIAAVIPPAAPVRPPVNTPIIPCSSTDFLTPVASRCPKPVSGVVAPHEAKSTKGWYKPNAESKTPDTTYPTSILAGVSFVLSINTCAITHNAPPIIKVYKYCILFLSRYSYKVSNCRNR